MNEIKVFKTSRSYWAQEISFLIFLVIFLIFAIWYKNANFYFWVGLAILYIVFYFLRDFRLTYNAEIVVNEFEIKGNVEGFAFVQSYAEIKAVAFSGRGVASSLLIGTENDVLQISTKFFDRKELEQEIRKHLPSEVFNPIAFRKLSHVQKFEQERLSQFDNLAEPLKVSLGTAEGIVGGVGVLFGIFMFVLYVFSIDNLLPLILAVFFCGLGLLLIVFSIGTIEADHEKIVLKTPFQQYTLSWNTLREVYIDLHNHTIVLTSDQCRIILSNTTRWSGKDRERLHELIYVKIEILGIQPEQGPKPLYWRSKNFRS